MRKKSLLSILLCFLLFFTSSCSSIERESIYNIFKDDNAYTTIICKLSFKHFEEPISRGESSVRIYIRDISKYDNAMVDPTRAYNCEITKTNEKVATDNGFQFENDDREYCVVFSPRIVADGWTPVVIAISCGDEVYLDYETGKANYLEWIKSDMQLYFWD